MKEKMSKGCDYLDEDKTGVEAIELTQEIPKETNSSKVTAMIVI